MLILILNCNDAELKIETLLCNYELILMIYFWLELLGQEIFLLSKLRHPNIVQYYGSETVIHICTYLLLICF